MEAVQELVVHTKFRRRIHIAVQPQCVFEWVGNDQSRAWGSGGEDQVGSRAEGTKGFSVAQGRHFLHSAQRMGGITGLLLLMCAVLRSGFYFHWVPTLSEGSSWPGPVDSLNPRFSCPLLQLYSFWFRPEFFLPRQKWPPSLPQEHCDAAAHCPQGLATVLPVDSCSSPPGRGERQGDREARPGFCAEFLILCHTEVRPEVGTAGTESPSHIVQLWKLCFYDSQEIVCFLDLFLIEPRAFTLS